MASVPSLREVISVLAKRDVVDSEAAQADFVSVEARFQPPGIL